jgi:3-isopropylmalate/(R)-2-methylmalate dehydratase small subunit
MMTSSTFARLQSRAVTLTIDDVDTDQIIPARYLKVIDKNGLSEGLFAEWRFDSFGEPNPEFPLNQSRANGASILVAGRNFGCGSSREHAVWALQGAGFHAVIAPSFADIFRSNALKNGLLVAEIEQSAYSRLVEMLEADHDAEVSIDIAKQVVIFPDSHREHFDIDEFSKRCLLEGIDSLGYLMSVEAEIQEFEVNHE